MPMPLFDSLRLLILIASFRFLSGPAERFWNHWDFTLAKVLKPPGLSLFFLLKHSESLKNHRD